MLRVTRYHPVLVALHWILAFLIIAALTLGAVKLAHMPNSDPHKVEGLRAHMMGGMLILALIVLRLFVRNVTVHPPKATTGSTFLDLVARISHRALYIAMIAMPIMGLMLAFQAGLFGVVFDGHGVLPPDLWV